MRTTPCLRSKKKSRLFSSSFVFAGDGRFLCADGDRAVLANNGKRLAFANGNFSGRRITHVADRVLASQPIEPLLVKAVAHVTHRSLGNKLTAI